MTRTSPTEHTSDSRAAVVDHYLRDAERNFTLVDLFAGIGGFHYGVGAAAREFDMGVEPLLVAEKDSSCRDTYMRNHQPAQEVVVEDVMGVGDDLLRKLPSRKADILTAGFPCQPFSNSGKKLGLSDPRGQFYDKIQELIIKFGAESFILENVPGIRTNGEPAGTSKLAFESGTLTRRTTIGRTMEILENAMITGLGDEYHINWIEIDSSRLGSPQVRRRVYIIGIRRELGEMPDLGHLMDNGRRTPFIGIADLDLVPGHEQWPSVELNKNQERNIRRGEQGMDKTGAPSFKDGMRRVGKAYACDGGNVGQTYHAHGLVPTLTKVWARMLPIYFPGPDEALPTAIDQKDFDPGDQYGSGFLRRASIEEVMRLQGFPDSPAGDRFRPQESAGRGRWSRAFEHAGNAVNAVVVREISRALLGRIVRS